MAMLLTITTTHQPATDLGYLLYKNPAGTQAFNLPLGYNLEADMVGDGYLFSRLRRLADPALRAPLAALSGDPTSMRTCEAEITDIGRAVFEGRENFVKLNGIDDWVLGVHLDSTIGKVWYRQDVELVPARRSA